MSKKEKWKLYMRNYRARNPVKAKAISTAQSRKWRAANPERNREISRKNSKDWARKNPERVREIHSLTLKNNPHIVLSNLIRGRVNRVLKGTRKSDSTFNLVGCTPIELMSYLEKQFRPGMTWENRGKDWHIDHRKPCASFDLSDPEQQKVCFHFSNLQPLWAHENLSKGARI